jgi:hypothetical protein
MFSGAGAGFDGHRADGGGAAFCEDDAVDAGAVGYTEKRAQVLRVFYAVKSEKEAARALIGRVGLVKVFNGEELRRANEGDDALMRRSLGELGQLLAGLVANGDTGLAAESDELIEPGILAFVGDQDVVKSATAGLDRFFDGMHAIENFHKR